MKKIWRYIKFYFYEIRFECGGGYKILAKNSMTRNQKAFGDFLVLKNEYIEWLKENTKGRVAIERMFILYNRDAYVTFAQKSEAIHFKLVWGGKC